MLRQPIDLLSNQRVHLPRQTALDELRADIVRAAYIEGDFVFTGGLRRSYYFDKYLFETRPAILRRLGRFMADMVPQDTERLAAPALGAVALGTSLSLELGLPLVIVRPEEEPGTERSVAGELYPGENVTLVEDVIVTGSRALKTVASVAAVGAECRHITCVLDREEGAFEMFEDKSIGYSHLFTPGELGIG